MISTVTKPQAAWPRNLGLIPGMHRDVSIVHSSSQLWGPNSHLFNEKWGPLSLGLRWLVCEDDHHLHLVLRLTINLYSHIYLHCTMHRDNFIFYLFIVKYYFTFLSPSATWYIVTETDVTQVSYKWNQLRTYSITNCGILLRVSLLCIGLYAACVPLSGNWCTGTSFVSGCSLKGVNFTAFITNIFQWQLFAGGWKLRLIT